MRRPVPSLVACTLILLVAAIMVAIFGSFCLDRIPQMTQMGFGLAVAVLLDATLIRVTLGLLHEITGNWNWWIPRRLGRLLPNSITDELPNAFYHVTGSSFIP